MYLIIILIRRYIDDVMCQHNDQIFTRIRITKKCIHKKLFFLSVRFNEFTSLRIYGTDNVRGIN